MDAQNAAESDPPKHAGAPSQQHHPRQSSGPDVDQKPSRNSRASSPLREKERDRDRDRDRERERERERERGRESRPSKTTVPATTASFTSSASTSTRNADDAPPPDRDSDAETIVLPGKDGRSPSKARKVRQEDRSESDGDVGKSNGQTIRPTNHGDKHVAGSRAIEAVKKNRLSGSIDRDRQIRNKDGASSGLSSAPASPPHHDQQQQQQQPAPPPPPPQQQQQQPQQQQQQQHTSQSQSQNQSQSHSQQSHQQQQQQHRHQHSHPHSHSCPHPDPHRHRSDAAAASLSDSEGSHLHKQPAKSSLRDKLKSGERLLPHKRKAPKAESDDEADQRKARRQRITSASIEKINRAYNQDPKSLPSKSSKHESPNRSISPHHRLHRRSISTQLPSHSPGIKKKRLPPPLHSTDYQSDESSASGSPHPRASKLRGLAISTADSHASPAKMAPHKKHLDAHGQTLLARACARGEYMAVKTRLHDRPEDLNVADYAGNTPLQIAAINGCEEIVELLINAGCNLDCVNYDKDTPLLDAVDNGHLGVVKLLLDAGVNPRKANVNGEEPIDRVNEDTENGNEIRVLLLAAKKRAGERQQTSEDRHSHADSHDIPDPHAIDSPRHSPAATMSATGRRSGTVRSTKTRNDFLYTPLDDKTLRQAAGRGDEETVARILQVKGETHDDPEATVAAARGGHDLVIQLLLGLGGANADSAPVPSLPAEFATPMLAAIGQENFKVVELLLGQQNFDPTRRFKGETYYEIARRRHGTNWKEEEDLLKNAYDNWKRTHKDNTKNKSPARREREKEREEKRARRHEAKEEARLQKRKATSPSRERESETRKKSTTSKLDSSKEKKTSDSITSHGDENFQKRAPHRPNKEERQSSHISDREVSPVHSHKPPKSKRTESDATAFSSESEAIKPRRKLVSKGELKGERERQKRTGVPSASSAVKDSSSPTEPSRNDEASEKVKPSEKYHDRTKALRRDESRDRLPNTVGDGNSKRHRMSITPDWPSDCDKDNSDVPTKRRRIEGDGQEKRPQKSSSSTEDKPKNSNASRDVTSTKSLLSHSRKGREEEARASQDERDVHRKDSLRTSGTGEKPVRVKSEDDDTAMSDVQQLREVTELRERRPREEDESFKRKELSDREDAKREEDRRQARLEEKRKREQEEARQHEESERKRKEHEEREMRKKRDEEEARKLQEEARKLREEARKLQQQAERERERERREAEEVARKQEEEKKKRRLEEERRRAEEEQRREEEKRREEERRREEEKRREEERLKKEEEERKKREEEERLHKEQIERQAAEEARRQRERQEEEERQERERRERAHREEMERWLAAREAEQKRLREEQERARLEKLPPLLRWLQIAPNAKAAAIAQKFKHMQGVRYDTISTKANNTEAGREQWVLNTQVALLLGEKDLELSKYPSWERVPVTHLAKVTIWRTEWNRYSLLHENLRDLGHQLPSYYDEDPCTMNIHTKQRLKMEAWDKFDNLDMFFVKVSNFMSIVSTIPHLHGIKLAVEYRELLEDESQAKGWSTSQKWKQDPDAARYHGFAPRTKYYINGVMVNEDMPVTQQTSKTPFPEVRVPRRGLVRVSSEDPDYYRICMEQGLSHLIKDRRSPLDLPNGMHSSPTSQSLDLPSRTTVNGLNGHMDLISAKDEAASPASHSTDHVNGPSS